MCARVHDTVVGSEEPTLLPPCGLWGFDSMVWLDSKCPYLLREPSFCSRSDDILSSIFKTCFRVLLGGAGREGRLRSEKRWVELLFLQLHSVTKEFCATLFPSRAFIPEQPQWPAPEICERFLKAAHCWHVRAHFLFSVFRQGCPGALRLVLKDFVNLFCLI